MRRLPRPKLVFRKFDAIARIMALFIAVITPNLVQVLCRAAQTYLVSIIVLFGLYQFGGVDSCGQGRAFITSSILLWSAAILFLPTSLSGKFWVTIAGSCFRDPGFRFFLLKVFCQLALCIGLSHGRVSWLGAPSTVLIHVLSGDPRP